jgi:hypothetical protein
MRISTTLLLLSAATLLGCGGSPDDGTGGGSSTSSGDTTSSGGTSGDGCERGLVRCGDTCRDIQNDDANCGACGSACGAGEACLSRVCKTPAVVCDGAGSSGTLCGAQCVYLTQSVDHCGGCNKACGAESYCSEDGNGTCKPWQGHGTSCESPIVISDVGNFSVSFWFVEGSAPRVFSCGALEPRPTVTFRWTPGKSDPGQKFKVYGATTDDLVIEVFSAAPCSSATSLGCNNDETATKLTPELQIPVEGGKPYFIVVGSVAAKAPLGRFELHLDD